MKTIYIGLLLALLCAGGCCRDRGRCIDHVCPFVGTDLHGHTFPGATVPFGMVQLSPDTRTDTWDGCSGYHYSDDRILGFSHTHLSGTGCLDYGDILFQPVAGYAPDSLDRKVYASRFSHRREEASPGYYRVFLDDPRVQVELTAGRRVGVHRYHYEENRPARILVDLKHRDELLSSEIRRQGRNAVSGFRRSRSWNQDQHVYFYAEFSEDIKDCRFFGQQGVLLSFDSGRIVAKVGISGVSEENARANLLSELPDGSFDFDSVRVAAGNSWERYLSRIDVRQSRRASARELQTFYTALYHTAIAPNLYSDVNGEYRGMDAQVHRADGFDRYTVFSLWDTFRSLHPLFTLIQRERTADFLKTFLTIFREGGKLPVWELAGWETDCMIGFHSASVISDAFVKGIGLEDAEDLLEAMTVSANRDEFGLPFYRERYLVPADREHESVSKTLEYAYDDWCIAVVADLLLKRTGEERYAEIRDRYARYAASYGNVFDPVGRFMRPVMGGMWLSPFRPTEVNNHYTEANSWQYSFFVPQDVSGLIGLMGGDAAFCGKIDSLFSAPSKTSGRTQADITGLVGQYAHGNEPSHHIAYLYAYAGQHWKTSAVVRHILNTLYSPEPDGLCGNDDCGQMSAWYVLSAIGLYPVTPGSDLFVLTAPLFDRIVLHLENGRDFVVEAHPRRVPSFISRLAAGRSLQRFPYVRRVTLNGQEHPQSFLRFADLSEGGQLTFELGRKPDPFFGSAVGNRPVSRISTDFLRNPVFEAEGDTFRDSLRISIAGADENTPIRDEHTLIRDEKTLIREENTRILCRVRALSSEKKSVVEEFVPYEGPFTVHESVEVSAYVEGPDGNRSAVTESRFYRLKDDMDIRTLCRYNPQYNARGERGLIDGLRGSLNWKTGGWQGFQDTDFTAIVDLRSERKVSLVGSGYCQDIRSWIWMPTYVDYSVSDDGEHFRPLGRVRNEVGIRDEKIQTKDFVLNLQENPVKCRYIKVFAKNFGTIPAWHPGAGGEGFIFIDEIWTK